MSLIWVQRPDKLNYIVVANFRSRKSFLSFKTNIFRNRTRIIYCSKLLIKNSLDKFAFSLMSVKSLLFSNNGGITGIFVPFSNVFKIDQQVLKAIWWSLSLIARHSYYFVFETFIAFDTSRVRASKVASIVKINRYNNRN